MELNVRLARISGLLVHAVWFVAPSDLARNELEWANVSCAGRTPGSRVPFRVLTLWPPATSPNLKPITTR